MTLIILCYLIVATIVFLALDSDEIDTEVAAFTGTLWGPWAVIIIFAMVYGVLKIVVSKGEAE